MNILTTVCYLIFTHDLHWASISCKPDRRTRKHYLDKCLEARVLLLPRLDHLEGKGLVATEGGSGLFQFVLPFSAELRQESTRSKFEKGTQSKPRQKQWFIKVILTTKELLGSKKYPSEYPHSPLALISSFHLSIPLFLQLDLQAGVHTVVIVLMC